MNDETDQQLLRDYAAHRSEAAFAELVRRQVDFVHSAALRMVCDAHLAQDVTQATFVALAQNASQLANHAVLSGWLHRTAQNLASKIVRTDVRRRAREQEAATMTELRSPAPEASWEQIAPYLDAALAELNEPDRDALLLRYFEKKSASEMAAQLGISDDAAQKRVSRAVERLREFFAKRGVTVGASGLAVVISANAVQAAPVGLALTISTTATLTGNTIATTATVTATKAIAMTALQKTIVTATIAVLAGAGIYETRQAGQLRNQVQTLQQQQGPQAEQIAQLEGERGDIARQLAALLDDNGRLNRNTAELLKLRGEISQLRKDSQILAELKATGRTNAMSNSEGLLPTVKPWRLREPRRFNEFENVGRDTPEAAAETVLWAAFYKPAEIADMICIPPEMINDEHSRSTIGEQLAKEIKRSSEVIQGTSQQVWLDGGGKTDFTHQTPHATNSYNGVTSFRLSGRETMDDPATEHHNDFLFTRIGSEWKLVIPGLSPEIR